jgi:hypothetical protein
VETLTQEDQRSQHEDENDGKDIEYGNLTYNLLKEILFADEGTTKSPPTSFSFPRPMDNNSGDISIQSLASLTTQMHVKTALQFFAQRGPKATRLFLLDLIKNMHPLANPSFGNARALYIIGKTSITNMRYTFKKTITSLAQAYIANHERYLLLNLIVNALIFNYNCIYRDRGIDGLPLPTSHSLQSIISWCHVEAAFSKSLQYVDLEFLDSIPDGSSRRVRTMLKNVIVNGVLIFIKHIERVDYVGDKEVSKQLYRLDALTPSPAFIGPERKDLSIMGLTRQGSDDLNTPLHLQLFDSDGEIEDVEL